MNESLRSIRVSRLFTFLPNVCGSSRLSSAPAAPSVAMRYGSARYRGFSGSFSAGSYGRGLR